MNPLLEGSEVSQLALESGACGLLEISNELLKCRKSVKPRGIVSRAGSRDRTRSAFHRSWWKLRWMQLKWTRPAKFCSTKTDMVISALTLNNLFNCWELWQKCEENNQYKLYRFTNLALSVFISGYISGFKINFQKENKTINNYSFIEFNWGFFILFYFYLMINIEKT